MYPVVHTEEPGHTHEICPKCGASQCDGLIKERIQGGPYTDEQLTSMYGATKCYGKTIGIEIRGRYDGVSYWRYPCCGLTVDRWKRTEVML